MTRNPAPGSTPDLATPRAAIEVQVALGLTGVHPGEILGEALSERSMSQAEFARRMGLTTKHVNRIIRGHAGYTATVALGMERVLGITARFWLMAQANHEVARARSALDPTPSEGASE